MKLLVVLSAVFALGAAKPALIHTPVQHQYHAQDELGQYTYGYSGGPSAKVESRTADGVTRGSYSYIDSNGIVQQVNYQADPVNGFRVAASNLPLAPVAAPVAPVVAAAPAIVAAPVPVQDTPEVVAARAEHLAAKAVAEAKVVEAPVVVPAEPVAVVAETPEVVAEKARHLAAVEEAKVQVASAVDDSHLHDDGSYKINPLEEDGSYKGEPVNVVLAHSAVGPVATVVTDDDSFLHDDGSYKINPFEDDGQYRGEGKVAVVGTNYIHSIAPTRTIVAGNLLPGLRHSYGYAVPHIASRYAVAAPAIQRVAYTAPVVPAVVPATHSQYHSQDELGQYTYGYTGGLSAKHETKTADGITRGGYSYIDANGIVQSVNYVSDPVHGFRVAATNLPLAPQ